METPRFIAQRKRAAEAVEWFEYWEEENYLFASGDKEFVDRISKAIVDEENLPADKAIDK